MLYLYIVRKSIVPVEKGRAMKILLPKNVEYIIDTLQRQGHEAYAVGGCIRDSILERTPEDWDITTSAMPEEVKRIFKRTFDTGIEHGTITILLDKVGYEVTTYRIDGKYEDHRHPKEVAFTRKLREDLLRRDFTINAMAYNMEDGLVDLFGGMQDLKEKKITCVGSALKRFEEDALRILRAVRFASQLGFAIEEETKQAIQKMADSLEYISAERIQVELVKMLVSPYPEHMETAYQLGITKVILPEFDKMMQTEQENPHHQYNVGVHTIHALQSVKPDKILRLAMLFHDMGKPETKTIDEKGVAHFKKHEIVSERFAKDILRKLKFDNDTIKTVSKLVLYHSYRMPAQENAVRRAMHRMGADLFPMYLMVRKADELAKSTYLQEEKSKEIEEIEKLYLQIKESGQCVAIKDLAISGNDLLALGIPQGAQIGKILQELLEEVLEYPEHNEKEILIQKINLLCN